jgi:hypothetical protein
MPIQKRKWTALQTATAAAVLCSEIILLALALPVATASNSRRRTAL